MATKKTTTRTSVATKNRPLKRIDMGALGQAADCLKTLAHPVRIRMVQLLLHDRYTVGELAEDCGVLENVASEHLRLMQRCGFFTSEREGRRVYYQVAEPHLESILDCIERRFQPS
ncbi:metalloregulator ArsR/SmtB family transcription factor [Aeoliella sp. ICT_H6.2]|uniref:Metalloregulator ArsR/SmtB family transcription factor n=1 Tax=Aeoliella straminimaris TaxID=2954799 RepID=A0A9X2JHU2_9BACT|nr:metalloregulator ArsR/SmtB family transcription factor [Aeoliella straminimaris]MCO6043259.1 metalloregulator ArsR/SmtB family transcription factor [Aeoliella straminimaris]